MKGSKKSKKKPPPKTGMEARKSYLLTVVAGGFAVTLVRNETQQHSAALKSAGQNPVSLLPLGGSGSAVPLFQLHPVFGAVSNRMPTGSTTWLFVDFGDKSWDSFKNSFQTQEFEFSLLSQRARRMAFANSIAPKTSVLKLNRPFVCKPPAATASESTRAAFASLAKPQVIALRHRRPK